MESVNVSHNIDPIQCVHSVIASEADKIVSHLRNVDRERIISILWMTVHVRDPSQGPEQPYELFHVEPPEDLLDQLMIEGREPDIAFIPSLLGAIAERGNNSAEDILESFENEASQCGDLVGMANRWVDFQTLKKNESSLYRLPQLADLILGFIDYLERNKELQIAQGKSVRIAESFPWLYSRLGANYPLSEIGVTPEERRDLLGIKIELLRLCADALDTDSSAELWRGRPTLFSNDLTGELWKNCLALLSKKLTTVMLDRFLELDRLHYGSDTIRNWSGEDTPHAGGLSDLLSVVADFCVELTTRQRSYASEHLRKCIGRNHGTGWPYLKFESYFAIPEKWRLSFNKAIDHFDLCRSMGPELKDEFRRKMNVELKRILPAQPGGQLVVGTLPYLFEYPEHLLRERSRPTNNVFRHNGDFWDIEFQGEHLPPLNDNQIGLKYIHHLIRNPGKTFSALSLSRKFSAEP